MGARGCVQALIPARPPPPRLSQLLASCAEPAFTLCSCRKVDCVSWSAEGMLAVVSGSTVHPPPVRLPSPCCARAVRRADLSTTHTQHRRGSFRHGAGDSAELPHASSACKRLIPRAGWIWPQVSLVDTVQQGKVGAIPLKRGDKSPLWGYGVNDYRYRGCWLCVRAGKVRLAMLADNKETAFVLCSMVRALPTRQVGTRWTARVD